jgi:hypothetical protein
MNRSCAIDIPVNVSGFQMERDNKGESDTRVSENKQQRKRMNAYTHIHTYIHTYPFTLIVEVNTR